MLSFVVDLRKPPPVGEGSKGALRDLGGALAEDQSGSRSKKARPQNVGSGPVVQRLRRLSSPVQGTVIPRPLHLTIQEFLSLRNISTVGSLEVIHVPQMALRGESVTVGSARMIAPRGRGVVAHHAPLVGVLDP